MAAQQRTQTNKPFWQRYSPGSLFAVTLLGICLVACGFNPACGTSSANPPCSPIVTPTPVHPKTTPASSVPTSSPTPTPMHTVEPSPTPATETDKQEVHDLSQHYVQLAKARELLKLYNLLSSYLRSNMSYEQFIYNPDYVLYPDSCWHEDGMILAVEKDGRTWDVGVFMEQITCIGGMTIATFTWHIRILVPPDGSGPPVVIRAGLSPTGA